MGFDHDKFSEEEKNKHTMILNKNYYENPMIYPKGKSIEKKSQYDECLNCEKECTTRKRSFSAQAWSVLLIWNEINPKAIDQPICDDCYEELRMTLIERMDEIEEAINGEAKKDQTVFNMKDNIAI